MLPLYADQHMSSDVNEDYSLGASTVSPAIRQDYSDDNRRHLLNARELVHRHQATVQEVGRTVLCGRFNGSAKTCLDDTAPCRSTQMCSSCECIGESSVQECMRCM